MLILLLLFIVEQVFPLMRQVWLMHDADIQSTVGGEGTPKGRKEFFTFKFFLSYHKVRIIFHTTERKTHVVRAVHFGFI